MNWKLIFLLSLFGLSMAVATVYFIPSNIEPFCWLAIFLVCAFIIARNTATSRFLHGLCLGLANCLWITAAQFLLFNQYLAHHPRESGFLAQSPLSQHPRLMMAIGGLIIGIVCSVIIGLLSLAAGRLTKSSLPSTKAMGQSA